MKKKKFVLACLAVSIIVGAIYFLMIPDVRNRPLTTREIMLFNPQGGETVELFEVRRGQYELHLYHYHLGERIKGELFNSIYIPNRTGMVAFYSEIVEDSNIGIGMRTEAFTASLLFEMELEGEYPSISWGPVGDNIQSLSVGEEKVLMTYQIESGGYAFFTMNIPAKFSDFEDLIDNVEDVAEHMALITITRVE